MLTLPEFSEPFRTRMSTAADPLLSRRDLLHAGVATVGMALAGSPESSASPIHANSHSRIHQSACRWCYPKISLDDLCVAGAGMGLVGIDLLQPDEYEIPRRYGLVCTMGYAEAGEISRGLNRLENHASIEAGLRKNLPLARRAGVKRVITFSGLRDGLSDDEGMRNTITGLKRMKPIVEDSGVMLCMELLNSKVNHPGYMADHTAWGVEVIQEVDSPFIRLLYDVYHMQIMEGDLITTIQQNIASIGHFHTGGVPGRHELNNQQEVQWDGVMRAIAATSFEGVVAHEFLPLGDPLTSLRQAVTLCAV